ncbi:ESPR domain-containing protein, partial [Pseudomonas syringae group genomosp. 7]
MNRIYRLVFNRALGVMQVASEVAQNPGGSAVCTARMPRLRAHQLTVALAATLASGSALAACTGTTTVDCDGTTNINNYSNATNGLTLNIASGALLRT